MNFPPAAIISRAVAESQGDLVKTEVCFKGCYEQLTNSVVVVPTQILVKFVSTVSWVCTKDLFLALTLSYLRVLLRYSSA